MRHLHLHEDQNAANAFESVCDQSRVLRLHDYVHDGPADGRQLLLRDLGVRAANVSDLRHVRITLWVFFHLDHDNDCLRPLQRHR